MTVGFENLPALLARAAMPGAFRMSDLPGGGNNKVYRIDTEVKSALLKVYFRDPADPRDRLAAEFSFSTFAWNAGIRAIPQPLAQDAAEGMGLYEFLEGRPLRNGEVDQSAVDQAVAFFRELNRHKSRPGADVLRPGSEACFTMGEHLDCVDRRMKRFDQLDGTTSTGEEARKLVTDRLIPAWRRIRAQVTAGWASIDEPLLQSDRCLSPSDFGFHNTIADASGGLKFIDFEYSGWDDPAKTVCDFFCQPDVTVPISFLDSASRAFVEELSEPHTHLRRINLLLPVYRVKWCCIILNDFLPVGSRRRAFAKDPASQEQRRIAQLQKVRQSLDAMAV
jgi:phosphotransferase family enzyme